MRSTKALRPKVALFALLIAGTFTFLFWTNRAQVAASDSKVTEDTATAANTNGKIAFVSTRILGIPKVFSMQADGTQVVCLMCDGSSDPSGTGSPDGRESTQPTVSPDGTTIAFVRLGEIWLMNVDGSNQRQLGTPASGSDPTWSPDGARIAFVRNLGGTNNEIFMMNADGSQQTNITNDAGNDLLPAWGAALFGHPQGRLAFRSSRDGNSEVYVIAPTSASAHFETSPQINITTNAAFDSAPDWSPDGEKVLFVSSRDNSSGEVYTIDLSRFPSPITRLTNDGFVDDTPSWSPDGAKVAFTSFRGNDEVVVIDANTGTFSPGNITNNAANDQWPDWGAVPVAPNPAPVINNQGFGLIPSSAVIGGGALTLTVNGSNFVNTSTVNFNGNSRPTTFVNSNQLTVQLLASDTQTLGAYPVTVVNPTPGGGTSNAVNFTVTDLPPISLAYSGRLRDRVRRGDGVAGLGADGDADGTFILTVPADYKNKTISAIDLCQKLTPCTSADTTVNRWDTIPSNGFWLIGVAPSLDGGLLNSSTSGQVSLPIGTSGESFRLFASNDGNSTAFLQGTTLSVKITFLDNTTATATTTIGNVPTTDLGLYISAENQTGGPLVNSIAVGQEFRSHPQVKNYGPLPATGVVVFINLPQGVVFNGNDSSNPTACSQEFSSSPVTCKASSTLAVGETLGFIFYVHANQAGTFNTTASVVSNLSEPIPDPHSNSFTLNTTTNSAADISISVTGDGDPVQVDAPLIYTIRVKNKGPLNAPNVRATLTFDENAAYVLYQGTSQNCVRQGTSRQIICTIGTLNSGQEVPLTIQVRANTVPNNSGHTISLATSAISDLFDYDSTNNNVTVTTTVVPNSPPLNDNFPSNLGQLSNYILPGMPGTVSGSTQLQGTVIGTNVGADRQVPIPFSTSGEVYHAGAEGGKSVWYVWLPPDSAGSVEFSTGGTSFDASRSTFNTLLEVYDIAVADGSVAPVLIASNDNITTTDTTSLLSFNYKQGHAYVIVVDGYRRATGFVALHWKVKLQATAQTVPQVITQMSPAIGCSRDSDQSSKFCKASYEAATGYHLLHVFGTGFTTDSRVRINNSELAGFDLDGHPINGFTQQITDGSGKVTELVAHIPPSPAFETIKINDVNVVTPLPAGTNATTKTSEIKATSSTLYRSNTGKLAVVTLRNATIPVNQTRTVCAHLDFLGGGETCIDFTNDGTQGNVDVTVDPTYFEVFAYCSVLFPGKDAASLEERRHCSASNGYGAERLAQQLGGGFAINPKQAIENGILKVAPNVSISAAALAASTANGGLGPQLLAQPGKIISTDGNSIISQDGGSIISQDGGSLRLANLAQILLADPNAIVAQGGGNIISQDGGSIISQDGGSLKAGGKDLPLLAASDLQQGSGGWFLVRSSGNSNPTYASTLNDDGSTDGKLSVTFDNTSNPRIKDLQGLAFSVALNPAVVQFVSTSITLNKSAGVAVLNLTRIGDTSVPVSVQYTTQDDTAKENIDYQPTSGNLFFGEGETSKQINVSLINTPSSVATQRNFKVIIGNAQGGAIMMPNMATITITSSAVTCTFTLSSQNANLPATAGGSTVGLTAAANDCAWTAVSNASWITITSGANGTGNGTVGYSVTANTSAASRTGTITIGGQTFTVNQAGSQGVQLSAQNYAVAEGGGSVQLLVTRADTSGTATINYATSDAAALNECNVMNGQGSSRCDYATSIGTLRFAAGESSKTIFVPIVDDGYAEGNETFTVVLSNPTGTTLGSPSTATVTIQDNETSNGANPVDGVDFFIRQNYIDFLGREPDAAGLAGWRNVLVNCGVTIAPPCDRIEVSAGFFRSEEFQSRGYFIYRFYSALGRIALSNEFFPDFAKLSGFLTPEQLEANKAAYVNEFMARAEFQTKYSATFNNPTAYVDALLQAVGLPNHPTRAGWLALLNASNTSQNRAIVLRQLVESSEVYNKYYNEAFVIMQYFGYLRRTADASYLNWIQTMNQTNGDYRIMINGFMNSAEYRRRFGP